MSEKKNYNKIVKCPCYNGDGYTYSFDRIDFNFCEVCNKKLFKQMFEQWKLERELETTEDEK